MATSNLGGGSIAASTVAGNSYGGLLPTTGDQFETIVYDFILDDGFEGDSVPMRSLLKKCHAVKIGLININSRSIHSSFELEDISITYRDRRVK